MNAIVKLIACALTLSVWVGCSAPRTASITVPAPSPTTSLSRADAAEKLSCLKQLVEFGELDLAEAAAKSIPASDPAYRGAQYYLSIINQTRQHLALGASRPPQPKVWIQTIPPRPIY